MPCITFALYPNSICPDPVSADTKLKLYPITRITESLICHTNPEPIPVASAATATVDVRNIGIKRSELRHQYKIVPQFLKPFSAFS